MTHRFARLDRVAFWIAIVLLGALAGIWIGDRLRARIAPHWPARGIVTLAPPGAAAAGRDRWIVAVQPYCPHCRESFVALARACAGRPDLPPLGLLLVDDPERPDTLSLIAQAPGGAWWDSAQVWRRDWRHGIYGELLVFDASGRLRRVQPPGFRP